MVFQSHLRKIRTELIESHDISWPRRSAIPPSALVPQICCWLRCGAYSSSSNYGNKHQLPMNFKEKKHLKTCFTLFDSSELWIISRIPSGNQTWLARWFPPKQTTTPSILHRSFPLKLPFCLWMFSDVLGFSQLKNLHLRLIFPSAAARLHVVRPPPRLWEIARASARFWAPTCALRKTWDNLSTNGLYTILSYMLLVILSYFAICMLFVFLYACVYT